MLLSAGIISIEVIFTIPLLTLTVVNGDARLIRDSENPTFINVSDILHSFLDLIRAHLLLHKSGNFLKYFFT